MKFERIPDHPDIARTLRDGGPNEPKTLMCDVGLHEIYPGEHYGVYGSKTICIDCVREEFNSLTAEEQIEKMEYDLMFFEG